MKKTKLISSLCLLALTICSLAFGVYAVLRTNFTANGTIKFNAYNCDVDIEVKLKGVQAGTDDDYISYQTDDITGITTETLKFTTHPDDTAFGGEYALTVEDTLPLGRVVFDEMNSALAKTNLDGKEEFGYWLHNIEITIKITNYSDFAVNATLSNSGNTAISSAQLTKNITCSKTEKIDKKEDGASAKSGTVSINLTANEKVGTTGEKLENNLFTLSVQLDNSRDAGLYYMSNTSNVPDATWEDLIDDPDIPLQMSDSTLQTTGGEWPTEMLSFELVFPSSVTIIDVRAFRNCAKLSSVIMPYGVVGVNASAFENCVNLYSIELSSSIDHIYANAFKGCSSLTTVNFPSSLSSVSTSAFANCTKLKTVDFSACLGNVEVGMTCFSNCGSLESVLFHEKISSIGAGCFDNCVGLTSITIPSSVSMIEVSAFRGCTGLTSIIVEGATSDNWAFGGMGGTYDSGTKIDLTNPSQNVTYFTSTYLNYSFYKKHS